MTTLVRNQRQWQTIWKLRNAGVSGRRKLPRVDFADEIVIAAFLGRRDVEGFSIQITEVRERPSGGLRVIAERLAPNPAVTPIRAIQSPYHFVRMKRPEPSVQIEVVENGQVYLVPLIED